MEFRLSLCKYMLAAAFGTLMVSASAAAEVEVKVGVLTDMSGPYADLSGSGSVVATQLAVEDFLATHPGVKVEVVSADHHNKPDVGVSVARTWYDVDGVDMIVDVTGSAVALAVMNVARDKNKVVMPTAGSSRVTGDLCTPNSVQWTYDTWANAKVVGSALVAEGGDSWYFITADYTFGHTLMADTTAMVEKAGGKVLGSTLHPLNTFDYSTALLAARSSGAKVIGLANGGTDMSTTIKQAQEFKVVERGQKIAALAMFFTDVHSIGLEAAQGLVYASAFYWDMNDKTRAFAKRYAQKAGGAMPTEVHAGVYSKTLHYLEAVAEVGSPDDGVKIVDTMKATQYDDPLFGKVTIRADGRAVKDMYLVEVKKPEESKYPWDYLKVIRTVPGPETVRPLEEGGCPLVK